MAEDKIEKESWLSRNASTISIISTVVAATAFATWTIKTDIHAIDIRLTNQINAVDTKLTGQMAAMDLRLTGQIYAMDAKLTDQIHALDRRLTAIETVMILQGSPLRSMAACLDEDISR